MSKGQDLSGWYGVDLDGTLAFYGSWEGPTVIGPPVPVMLERVKRWLATGREVRIFTARVFPLGLVMPENDIDLLLGETPTPREKTAGEAVLAIQMWCKNNVGRILPITCIKDYGMLELWDDRAVQVVKNTGLSVTEIASAHKAVTTTHACGHSTIKGTSVYDPTGVLLEAAGLMAYVSDTGLCYDCSATPIGEDNGNS